jgi:predicted nucleic acid-binding protein
MAVALVDTSCWIDYLRHGSGSSSEALETLLKTDQAAICGVIEAELLRGLREEERGSVELLLEALPYLEMDREDYQATGALLGSLRSKGVTLPLTDGLIAAVCLRYNLPLLTLDKHFTSIPGLHLIGS